MKDLRFFLAVCCLSLFFGLFPFGGWAQGFPQASRITTTLDESHRIVIKGSTPALARREFDTGIAPDNLPMESVLLVLKRSAEQEAALQELLNSQQTKGSPNFHKWLSPAEFGAKFGPSDADVAAVTKWLMSHGFRVKNVSPGRTVLEFSGTAGQVQSAFHTEIHKYVVGGREHWANDRDVEIPAAFAPVVHGLLSLNNFSSGRTPAKPQSFLLSRSGGKTSGATPDVTLVGCSGTAACYGVGPADFATIYDVNPLYMAGIDGSGETIAIASSSNIHLSDTQNFRQLFNLPANDPQIVVVGPDPGPVPGDEGLTNLQVQWAGAVAPKATIELVVTQSTTSTEGANLSAVTIVNGNLAPVMTLNFTDCEPVTGQSGSLFYQVLWEQGAAQGMTVVAPAGDMGAAGCDNHFTEIAASQGLAVNAVASTAFNVAVGGTDFDQVGNWSQFWNSSNAPNSLASAKSYIPEETYNDSCAENGPNGCSNPNISGSDLVAGGGGCSIYVAAPKWQSGTGACVTTGARAVPDVSMFAGDGNNGSFYLVCQGDANGNGDPSCNLNSPYLNIQGVGGTTAAAAVFAGVMALVDQKNGAQGNANVVLYPLAASSTANAFHDITKGDTSVACVAASFQDCSNQGMGFGIIADVDGAIWSTSPGYDLATGLGSVDVNNLVTNWTSIQFQSTTTTIVSVNPSSSSHGQSVTFNITVASGGGTPTGDVALMVDPSSPVFAADVFTLANGAVTANTTRLPGGSYPVFARYAGDGTFAPSDSAPVNITVAQQSSNTTIQIADFSNGPLNCFDSGLGSQNNGFESYGAVYFMRVVVGNIGDQESPQTMCFPFVTGKSVPTGTIMLTDNGSPLGGGSGVFTLNGRGYLEIPTVPTALGPHTLMATYSGDSSYASSSSTPFSVLIDKANSILSLAASASLVGVGQNVTILATLFNANHGSGFLPPSGTVTFMNSDGTILGTQTLGPNSGSATISSVAQLTLAVNAPITVTAQYGGDSNYKGSVSPGSVTVNVGNPDFSVSHTPATLALTAGQPGTATITVTPVLGFTGAVALACPPSSSLPPGMGCSVSPSTVTPGVNGKPVNAMISLTSQGPSVVTAKAQPLHRQPRWMSAFSVGSLACAAFLIVGSPQRRRLVLVLMVIFAAYACGSCSAVVTHSTNDSQIALATSAVKSAMGTPLTLTGAVSADHQVSGTVDFMDNGTPIAQNVPIQVGRAVFTTNSLVLGTHPLTASYSGDGGTHGAHTTTPLNQVITGSSQLQITATSGNLTHNIQLQFSLN